MGIYGDDALKVTKEPPPAFRFKTFEMKIGGLAGIVLDRPAPSLTNDDRTKKCLEKTKRPTIDEVWREIDKQGGSCSSCAVPTLSPQGSGGGE